MERFNVLSLFDGGSMTYPSLLRAGVPKEAIRYYAVEIDSYARKVGDQRVPNIIRPVNDVQLLSGYNFPQVDLLIAGSPCQNLSIAGNGEGLKGSKSSLFWEFVRIWRESKPKYWLLENVASMRSKDRDKISEVLGVLPIRIESELVSAQKRSRLYWTNIPDISQPVDAGIMLDSILENGEVDRDKSYCLDANYFKGTNVKSYINKSRRQIVWQIPEATKKGYVEVSNGNGIDLTFIRSKTRRGRLMLEKSNALTVYTQTMCKVVNDWFRKLTPLECERLQTLPDGWTDVGLSDTQRYRIIGNGFTVDVIAHILSYIPELNEDDDTKRTDVAVSD